MLTGCLLVGLSALNDVSWSVADDRRTRLCIQWSEYFDYLFAENELELLKSAVH